MNELLKKCIIDAKDIIDTGFGTTLGSVSFEFCNCSDKDIATTNEWAEATSFFNHIKACVGFMPFCDNVEKESKALLNEMRPILMNQNDTIYFCRIIHMIMLMLNGRHKTETKIRVIGENGCEVTEAYKSTLKEMKKHINAIISKSDFEYVYNRLLQHSDTRYQERYLSDIKNDSIPYILVKNAILASYIAELLASFLQPLLMFYMQCK